MDRRLLAMVCLATSIAGVVGACSGDANHDVSSGTVTPGRDASAKGDIAQISDATDDWHVPVIDGWESFDDYDARCQHYLPKIQLPPPQWESCESEARLPAGACRSMIVDWEPPIGGGSKLGTDNMGHRRKDGSLVLMTKRVIGGDVVATVTALDGPVYQAIRQRSSHCTLGFVASDGDVFALRVDDDEASGSIEGVGGGVIGAHIGERPRVLAHHHDKSVHEYFAGSPGVAEVRPGSDRILAYDGSVKSPIPLLPAEQGAYRGYWFWSKEALFWAADVKPSYRESVFTQLGGARNLLDSGADPNDGLADLGSDGTDLVWAKASVRPSPSGLFENVALYAAPFTTEASALQPRLLRSDLGGFVFAVSPAVVGCGYAARYSELKRPGAEPTRGVLLVRLSDGAAWMMPSDEENTWAYQDPIALSCEELVVSGWKAQLPLTRFIARIRLSELGPPIPAK